MTRRRPIEEDAPLVELTPMIDVVFLLLIFFMVSTRFFDPFGFNVELPEAEAAPHDIGTSDQIVVAVQADGTASVQGNTLRQGEPLPELNAAETVVIQADRRATHGDVIYWMDELQKAGVKSVTLASTRRNEDVEN